MHDVKINYALKDNKVVSILDISPENRGLKCNCICPICHEKLSAKLGSKNQHHFSHVSNSTCDPANVTQTALHILAKELIEEYKLMTFPSLLINFSDTNTYKNLSPENKIYFKNKLKEPFIISKEKSIKFDSVVLENKISSIIPDIVGTINNKCCLIEIAVSHFVDQEKKDKVKKLNFPMIEIDLSAYVLFPLNKNELKKKIISDIDCKKWIFNPKIISEMHKADDYFKNQIEQIIATEKNEFETRNKEYAKEIESVRNNSSFLEYYKETDLYKKFPIIPFFLDIPIEGELAIKCDRRIWQSLVFESLMLTQSSSRRLDFYVLDNYIKYNFETSNQMDYSFILKQFLLHLNMLGFIEYYSFAGFFDFESYMYIKIPNSIIPPHQKYANELSEAIANSDPYSLKTAHKIAKLYQKFSKN